MPGHSPAGVSLDRHAAKARLAMTNFAKARLAMTDSMFDERARWYELAGFFRDGGIGTTFQG
jgi:hypothetical protein